VFLACVPYVPNGRAALDQLLIRRFQVRFLAGASRKRRKAALFRYSGRTSKCVGRLFARLRGHPRRRLARAARAARAQDLVTRKRGALLDDVKRTQVLLEASGVYVSSGWSVAWTDARLGVHELAIGYRVVSCPVARQAGTSAGHSAGGARHIVPFG
jgi:hypothetical protein